MNIGDKVIFWKDTRPLLDQHGYPAVVTGMGGDGKTASVTVKPPHTGRSFSAFGVPVSDRAAPGVVTAEGVAAHSQHAPDDRIAPGTTEEPKPEPQVPSAQPEPQVPSAQPEPRATTRRGSSGGSAAPAAETA